MLKCSKSIKARMAIIYILVISIIIIIISIFFTTLFGNVLLERVEKDQEVVMKQIKLNVENVINNLNQSTWYLYNDMTFANLANCQEDNPHIIFQNKVKLDNAFRSYVKSPIPQNDYIAFMYLYPSIPISSHFSSVNINQLDNQIPGYSILNASEVMEMEWFKETDKKQGRFHVFLLDDNKQLILFSRLIKNRYIHNTDKLGYMGITLIGIDVKHLKKQIEFSKLTQNSKVYLVNNDNTIVLCNDEKDIGQKINDNFIKMFSAGETKKVKYNKKTYQMSYYDLNWDLRLISTIPYTDINKNIDFIKKIGILISIVCIGVSAIISLFISESIASPIVKLSKKMKQVSDEQNMNIKIETCYKDEVGQLYNSFNDMLEKINLLVKDIYENAQIQQKLKLSVLQAQINPHFIYNTLDSIGWMALCNDEKEISKMVSSLSFIMRYSIKDLENLVTIKEELKHVKSYIDIQKIRYNDNFNIQYHVNIDNLNYKMPKFIIQPIVENSIIHGVEEIEEEGTIIIKINQDKENIVIVISDNGIGCDAEELNTYLNGDKTKLIDSDGFGIKNVDERLKINYGNSYGLSYHSNLNGGVTAEIVFPVKK